VQLHCPACGYENLTGAEVCDNCGADLGGHDVPQQAGAFRGRLMGAQLDALGIPEPIIVSPDTSVAEVIDRMHVGEADSVLVV